MFIGFLEKFPVYLKLLITFHNFSLIRQVNAINKLSTAGMYFWDYGNAFLYQASLAGKDQMDVYNKSVVLQLSFVSSYSKTLILN